MTVFPPYLLTAFPDMPEVVWIPGRHWNWPENFELSDQIAHANLCGFGKSVIQAVLEGKVEQLVLVNCCDSMRRVYDIVESTGKCKFLYMLDMPHEDNDCEKVKLAQGIHRLKAKNSPAFPQEPHIPRQSP